MDKLPQKGIDFGAPCTKFPRNDFSTRDTNSWKLKNLEHHGLNSLEIIACWNNMNKTPQQIKTCYNTMDKIA